MNWKEKSWKLVDKWLKEGMIRSISTPNLEWDLNNFISTEIIEKLVKDFEESFIRPNNSRYTTISSTLLKIKIKQLRDKWL